MSRHTSILFLTNGLLLRRHLRLQHIKIDILEVVPHTSNQKQSVDVNSSIGRHSGENRRISALLFFGELCSVCYIVYWFVCLFMWLLLCKQYILENYSIINKNSSNNTNSTFRNQHERLSYLCHIYIAAKILLLTSLVHYALVHCWGLKWQTLRWAKASTAKPLLSNELWVKKINTTKRDRSGIRTHALSDRGLNAAP